MQKEKLSAGTEAANIPSQRVLEKAGFKRKEVIDKAFEAPNPETGVMEVSQALPLLSDSRSAFCFRMCTNSPDLVEVGHNLGGGEAEGMNGTSSLGFQFVLIHSFYRIIGFLVPHPTFTVGTTSLGQLLIYT